MKYFAYGSNLNRKDLIDWCKEKDFSVPRLENPRPFCLKDYRLGFTRKSKRRKGGVADIICEPGDCCWGVVFDVTDGDLDVLDCKEGVGSCAYRRISLPDDMITYVVCKKDFVKPHQDYVDLIIEGARYYGLPKGWIARLESFKQA